MNYQVLKTYLITLAACALCACSNEDVVLSSSGAITFGQPIVNSDSDTRTTAESDIKTLYEGGFGVYGYIKNYKGETVQIFQNEHVTRSSAKTWTYSNTQYWFDANSYSFVAIAPFDNPATTVDQTAISFDNSTANGEVDLIAAIRTFDNPPSSKTDSVGFTFNHLLSRVKFRFINDYKNIYYKINITSATVTSPKRGTFDATQTGSSSISTASWSDFSDDTYTLDLGAVDIAQNVYTTEGWETNKETVTDYKYIIPGAECTIAFQGTITSTFSSTSSDGTTIKNIDFSITESDFKPGKSYILTAKLSSGTGDEVITFDVSSTQTWKDWQDVSNGTTSNVDDKD